MSIDATTPRGIALRAGAEPFFVPGGPTGVLCVHGYSGSPAELRPLGHALASAGYTVAGPLLAGHGGLPADLSGARWQVWVADAEAELQRLGTHCERVFVVGLSMGALIALHLAARRQLAGVVTLAPALRLHGEQQLAWTGLAKYVMPWFYPLRRANFNDPAVQRSIRQWAPNANLDDPQTVALIRREARIPVGSLHELVKLQRQARRDLPSVTAPILLLQGRHDQVVDLRWADEYLPQVGSPDKQLIWYERSGHLLATDIEREAVWATVREWIAARALA